MDDDFGPSWTDAVWQQNPMFESARARSESTDFALSHTGPGQTTAPAQWYPDPLQRHAWRYWDGVSWTEYVADDGSVSTDPL